MAAPDALLADAELGKDLAKEVVRRYGARYLAQGLVGEAQLFGEQFAGARLGQCPTTLVEMAGGPTQRIQVAAPRRESAFTATFMPPETWSRVRSR